MPPPLDPDQVLRHLQEAGANFKFGAGVLGKTSRAMLALVGAWAIVLTRLSNDLTFDAVLVASAFLLTIVMVWWVKSTQNFAERNPGQALLDGAQLIEYKKFEAESKGMAAAGRSMLTDDPSRVIEIKPINDEPDA